MFCTQCGSQLKEKHKFCTNCGSSAEPATQPSDAFQAYVPQRSSATTGRPLASKSSSALAAEPTPAQAPSFATAEVPRAIAPVKFPKVVVLPQESRQEIPAPRRTISRLLIWGSIGALALVTAVVAVLFVRWSHTSLPMPDGEIERSIQAMFATDPDMSKCTVQVRSRDGVVTLTGSVNKGSDRSTASRMALQQPGVKTVVDNLVVTTIAQVPAAETNTETNNATASDRVKTVAVRVDRASTAPETQAGTRAVQTASSVSASAVAKTHEGIEITSVGPISPQAWQTVVIRGANFGMNAPFNGCSDFIRITDLTTNRIFPSLGPFGGCANPILVTSWTDAEIVIEGLPAFQRGQDAFSVGDMLKIEVRNPQQAWAPMAWYSVRVTPSSGY